MAEFAVRGAKRPDMGGYDPGVDLLADLVHIRVSEDIDLSVTRAGGDERLLLDVPEGGVLEAELENGLTIWVRDDEIEGTFTTGTRGDGPPELTGSVEMGPKRRGLVGWALKGLRLLDIDLVDAAADVAAIALAARIEDRAFDGSDVKGPGLYRAATPYQLSPVAANDIPTEMPILVMIHGTGSTTAASFGALAGSSEAAAKDSPSPLWESLRATYGDRIFALQHRTLSDSPVRNAIEMLEALPKNARLHLLSYSRGGLVGELIARAGAERLGDDGRAFDDQPDPIDALDLELFEKASTLEKGTAAEKKALAKARVRDVADLARLNALLIDRAPKVERFVRVASPTRGTTLASGRLDKYLTLLVNVIEHVPFLSGNPIVDLTKAFLLAVVKTRTDPAVIPGLEAMMPQSPLIAMLNRPDLRLPGRLSVIAGDIEAKGLFQSLAVYASDLFYPDDHDLVVDTEAMVGGSVRVPPARYFFDKGAEVNHFAYFANERTRTRILTALTATGENADKGFRMLDDPSRLTVRAVPRSTLDPAVAPHVFLLPGIMGSTLRVGNNRVWLDYFDMAFGGIRALDPDSRQSAMIQPGALIEDYYLDLHAHLTRTHIVHPFPYDWRRSVLENGQLLGQAVAAIEEGTRAGSPPIRFVGHSMGGLVVRAMTRQVQGVWDRVRKREGCRIVMLGTPNGGAHSAVAGLIGQSETVRQLALLDITNSRREVLNVISRLPGFLDLLPTASINPDEADGHFLNPATWAALAEVHGADWVPPSDEALEGARRTRDTLGAIGEDVLNVLRYVAGTDGETPVGLRVDNEARGVRRLRVINTDRGDGRVTWKTGVPASLPESRCYLSPATHGDLARDAVNFTAITDLLQRGETGALPHLSRAEAGKVDPGSFFESRSRGLHRPDHRSLRNLPLGGARLRPPPPVQSRARVSIVHGNLAFCSNVVAVGHYRGEILVGAEHFIDTKLDGRLSKRRALGLYPGPVGTGEVVMTDPGPNREAFQGALIMGLGRFGELDVETLTRCMTYAFTLYALRRRESIDAGAAGQNPPPRALSTLLIGHQESRLNLRDSTRAALDALVRTNTQLEEDDQITELQFVELFEDSAVAAADMLRDEAGNPRYRDLEIDYRLGTLKGARRRISHGKDEDWVQRIEIRGDDQDSLSFTTHSDTAIAAEDLVTRNRSQIDRFIEQMTSSTRSEDRISQLLFEMLFPRAIKPIYSSGRAIQLTVDEETANYPWELLDNGFSDTVEPIAVTTPIVRQLLQARSDLMPGPGGTRGVLVVGDPQSDFPELPGARAEARQVHAAFSRHGGTEEMTLLDQPVSFEVQVRLLLEKYRIVHLAGHGVSEYVPQGSPEGTTPTTGMVIGPAAFLTSDLIAKMSYPPEFVFLNCCNLARLPRLDEYRSLFFERHRLAASLAVQFMRCGAKAVIAAGWEVEDRPAEAFANMFYACMLEGYPFADAVTRARQAAYQANPGSNTWGAYQCYGDPSFTFHGPSQTISTRRAERPFSSIAQAIASVENISRDATNSAYANKDIEGQGLLAKLDRLDNRLAPEWREDPELVAAVGTAYMDLNEFEKAIPLLEKAVTAERTRAPIQLITRLANIRARVAVDAPLDADDRLDVAPGARAQVERAIREIKGLIHTLEPTVERFRLLASAYKRLSMVRDYTDLEEAVSAYARAVELSRLGKALSEFDTDPAINARLCASVCIHYAERRQQKTKSKAAADVQRRLKSELRALPSFEEIKTRLKIVRKQGRESFWNWAMMGDLRLAECIRQGRIADSGNKSPVPWILADYERAWNAGANSAELSSVVETIKFIRVIWGRLGGDMASERAALRDIYNSLIAFPGYNERL